MLVSYEIVCDNTIKSLKINYIHRKIKQYHLHIIAQYNLSIIFNLNQLVHQKQHNIYSMFNLAHKLMPYAGLGLKYVKKSPVPSARVVQNMFSNDKNKDKDGNTSSNIPANKNQEIKYSHQSSPPLNTDSAKEKVVPEVGNAQRDKEEEVKDNNETVTTENKEAVDSASKKEIALPAAASKQEGQLEKQTGKVVVEPNQYAEIMAVLRMMAESSTENKKTERKMSRNSVIFGLGRQFFNIFVAIVGLGIAIYFNNWFQNNAIKTSKEALEKQLCDKYCAQDLEVPEHFVHNTSIEKQIKSCLRREHSKHNNNKVDFFVGVPGTGKTTAIKHIITKMRQENAERKKKREEENEEEDIYYFSLRFKDGKSRQNLAKKVKEMQNLFTAISNQRKGKTVRVVVDDINYLGSSKNFLQTESMISGLLDQRTQVVVVSSCSTYAAQAENHPIGRQSNFMIINTPSASEINDITRSMFQRYKDRVEKLQSQSSIPPERKTEILNKAYESTIKFGLPLRTLQEWLKQFHQFQNLNEQINQKSLEFKQSSRTIIKKLIGKTDLQSELMERSRCLCLLLEGILDSPDKIDTKNTLRILKPFEDLSDILLYKVSQLLESLQNKNFLIYGKPRHKIYKDILEEILDEQLGKMKEQAKTEKKAN